MPRHRANAVESVGEKYVEFGHPDRQQMGRGTLSLFINADSFSGTVFVKFDKGIIRKKKAPTFGDRA